jgi:WD40 repeat protein
MLLQTDPKRFVSGSDDGTVRLWSIRDEAPMAVIDAKANVCSVQFSPVSSHLLAFGSANYRMYLYDMRRLKVGRWLDSPLLLTLFFLPLLLLGQGPPAAACTCTACTCRRRVTKVPSPSLSLFEIHCVPF